MPIFPQQIEEPTPEELAEQAAKEQAYTDKLKALGYKLDGSLEDWLLLMNDRPIFGENWEHNARENFSLNMDFLQFIKIYIK